VQDEGELDTIYNITATQVNHVEPDKDGKLIWENASSWDGESEQALKDWQNRLYEVSMKQCSRVTKSLCWIGTEVCTFPSFDGSNDLEKFLSAYQVAIP